MRAWVASLIASATVAGFISSQSALAGSDGDCTPTPSSAFAHGGGVHGSVNALLWHDDGDGPALYVTGQFTRVAEMDAVGIARWNGAAWQRLGDLFGAGIGHALTVADLGAGPRLYVGGRFASADSSSPNIAEWDGERWRALGAGTNGPVFAVTALADGSVNRLIAAGQFNSAGSIPARNIAQWDGAAWSPFPAPLHGIVRAVTVWDDGAGPALYAAGRLTDPNEIPVAGVVRWSGSEWQFLGGERPAMADVYALTPLARLAPRGLLAGGNFETAGSPGTGGFALWTGADWASVGGGLTSTGLVTALAEIDTADGPSLYVGGLFLQIGNAPIPNIARWNGEEWNPVVPPLDGPVNAVCADAEGAGARVFLAGNFLNPSPAGIIESIGRIQGGAWLPVEGPDTYGPGGAVICASPISYVAATDGAIAGLYTTTDCTRYWFTPPTSNIARWDGESWHAAADYLYRGPCGSFISCDPIIRDVAAFDTADGTSLILAGEFNRSTSVPVSNIAAWEDGGWNNLAGGVNGYVLDVLVMDLDSETCLIAAGSFTHAGGLPALNIAAWNGSSWRTLGDGLTGIVRSLAIFDDGGGPALFAAGDITAPAEPGARGVVKWNGTAWEPIPGFEGSSALIRTSRTTAGPVLNVAHGLATVDDVPTRGISQWNGSAWTRWPISALGTIRDMEALNQGDADAVILAATSGLGSRLFRLDEHGLSTYAQHPSHRWFSIEVGRVADAQTLFVAGQFSSFFDTSSAGIGALVFCPRRCPGDANTDGWVGLPDLAIVIERWNEPAATDDPADSNADGVINLPDLAAIIARWHVPCP